MLKGVEIVLLKVLGMIFNITHNIPTKPILDPESSKNWKTVSTK